LKVIHYPERFFGSPENHNYFSLFGGRVHPEEMAVVRLGERLAALTASEWRMAVAISRKPSALRLAIVAKEKLALFPRTSHNCV
jgi:hypothetical protein